MIIYIRKKKFSYFLGIKIWVYLFGSIILFLVWFFVKVIILNDICLVVIVYVVIFVWFFFWIIDIGIWFSRNGCFYIVVENFCFFFNKWVKILIKNGC